VSRAAEAPQPQGAASGQICFHASDAEQLWLKDNKVRLTPGSFSQSIQFGHWLYLAGQDAIDLHQLLATVGYVGIDPIAAPNHLLPCCLMINAFVSRRR
jgi:hypothetical protein